MDLLHRAGRDVEDKVVEKLTRFYCQCQLYREAPGRFKVRLPEEYDFNHTISIDIVNMEGDNALRLINMATSYQAGQFIHDMSTATVWNALRACWMDVYLGVIITRS